MHISNIICHGNMCSTCLSRCNNKPYHINPIRHLKRHVLPK